MARTGLMGLTSPSFLHSLGICNFVILGIAVIIDIVGVWELHSVHEDDPNSTSTSRVSGIILILVHLALTLIQLYFAFMLYAGVQNRDFAKCRQWFDVSIYLIGFELTTMVLFSLLSPYLGYFASYALLGLMYKFFQLWPVDGFILDLESSSQPLVGDSQYHM